MSPDPRNPGTPWECEKSPREHKSRHDSPGQKIPINVQPGPRDLGNWVGFGFPAHLGVVFPSKIPGESQRRFLGNGWNSETWGGFSLILNKNISWEIRPNSHWDHSRSVKVPQCSNSLGKVEFQEFGLFPGFGAAGTQRVALEKREWEEREKWEKHPGLSRDTSRDGEFLVFPILSRSAG